MTDEQPSTKKTAWRLGVVLALSVVLDVGIGGQWWTGRPKRSAEHFTALLSKGQINEATEILFDASSLQTGGNDNITIKATDGTTATLTDGDSPMMELNSVLHLLRR